MLVEKLVDLIGSEADEMARAFYEGVKNSHYTPHINDIPPEEVLRMATNVYAHLNGWLISSSNTEIAETYKKFGSSLYYKGFRMEEVLMVLVLIKRYLWLHLLEMGLLTTNIDVYKSLELNNKVVLYFDRAVYYALVGFRDTRERALDKKK
ncbi:MAG: hypothetical protein PHO53_05590 [Actinomycetota bacterium]|nr:hypothetical protein [Actinomycetota bacterium]